MSWRDEATPVGGKTSWRDEATPVEAPKKEGAGQAALESFGNAAMLGYLPHLQALAAKVTPNPSAALDADLAAKGFKIEGTPEKNYVQTRDENIARQKQQKADFPVATTAGTVAGMLTGGLMIPGSAAMKGATLGGKVARGALTGGALGAIQNPGDVEGDITLMPEERAKNAAMGGAIGGLIPPILAGGEWLASKGRDFLSNKAAEKAFRSLGKPTPTVMQRMTDTGQNVEIGRELLNEGAIPVLGTPKRIAERVGNLKEVAGEEIGNLVSSAGNAKIVDAEKLGIQILDSPELALMRKTPGMEGAVSTIEKQVETLAKNGQMDVAEAQKLRRAIDESLYKNSHAQEFTGAKEGLHLQRSGIRDAMNEGINNLNPGAPKDRLLAANRKYSNLAQASEVLDKELARNQSNRAISLTDTIAAGAGASAGSPAAALILGALNKAGRTFGNSMQARGYDTLANLLAKSAPVVAMAQNNPGVVARLAAGLGQEATGGTQNYNLEEDELLKDPEILMLFKKDPSLIDAVQDPKRRAIIRRKMGRMPASA